MHHSLALELILIIKILLDETKKTIKKTSYYEIF